MRSPVSEFSSVNVRSNSVVAKVAFHPAPRSCVFWNMGVFLLQIANEASVDWLHHSETGFSNQIGGVVPQRFVAVVPATEP